MSKEIKLTNWQVPQDPRLEFFRMLNRSPELNIKNYENMGQVEYHDSVESVAEKMIAKQELQRGRKINEKEAPKPTLNFGGINDNRERKFWSPK